MATIKVSSSSGLASALKIGRSGDAIELASGHYTLSTNGLSKDVTITSNGLGGDRQHASWSRRPT